MLNIHHDESRPSRVTVAFEDGALSFMLSMDATFEDVADRLGDLNERCHGKPIAIQVKFAASPTPGDFDSSRDLVAAAVSSTPHQEGRPIRG